MKRLAVINVVGLTKEHLGKHTPNITSLANKTSVQLLDPPLPAVTSTVQTSLLTGLEPKDHGIVANGWHERETNATHFWRQSNSLVKGEMIWDAAKKLDPNFTCANMFWWFNMYSSADIAVTPRPLYCADGRKIPDIWTNPPSLRTELQQSLGQFPLFNFWGPMANITSSKWIADATIIVEQQLSPTLMLIYLPHLDYPLQKVGPNHPSIVNELKLIDHEVGKLIDHFTKQAMQVCVISEYGIDAVSNSVPLNKILRDAKLLSIREELGREYLDAGQSRAFAVPDHQLAHVYVKNKKEISDVASLLSNIEGVDQVLQGNERGDLGHERCGELVVIAKQGYWFTHDWWKNESSAPDYQQTVDIHRKPGYDPRELFLAKGWRGCKPRIALKILAKKMGFTTLFDVIETDPSVVQGSHGLIPAMGATAPVIIPPKTITGDNPIPATSFKELILSWMELS
jgi:predicted AlkP superfamily pyrophosphatase or phosphodiesterase|tara:strand:+ start:511 stop:1878 length:1368 start_codon:yes stop_codon:yes gene_type:complete